MKKLHFISILLLSTFLFSCSNDEDNNEPNPQTSNLRITIGTNETQFFNVVDNNLRVSFSSGRHTVGNVNPIILDNGQELSFGLYLMGFDYRDISPIIFDDFVPNPHDFFGTVRIDEVLYISTRAKINAEHNVLTNLPNLICDFKLTGNYSWVMENENGEQINIEFDADVDGLQNQSFITCE